MDSLETISPQQAAAKIGVSHNTVRKWCELGLLPSKRLPTGNRVRIRLRDLEDFYNALPSAEKKFQNAQNLSD